MAKYKFTVEGTSVEENIWKVNGEVKGGEDTLFEAIAEFAVHETFYQLTQGNAVYGYPGKGCNGPYKITKLLIEKVK